MHCTSCGNILDLLINTDDDVSVNTCGACGVINYVNSSDIVVRHMNVSLIKSRIREVLADDMFIDVSDEIKSQIEDHAVKIGTHVKSTLVCFSILFIEYKCKMSTMIDFVIKKKQRKNVIKILVDIARPDVMKFVRTPLTYIEMYSASYTQEERDIYESVSKCLMFLNACNKKSMCTINSKIHSVIVMMRNNEPITISASCNMTDMIKYIILKRITIDDLIRTEEIVMKTPIIHLFRS